MHHLFCNIFSPTYRTYLGFFLRIHFPVEVGRIRRHPVKFVSQLGSPDRQPRPSFWIGPERPRLVAPLRPHEAGDLGGELEVLEGSVERILKLGTIHEGRPQNFRDF